MQVVYALFSTTASLFLRFSFVLSFSHFLVVLRKGEGCLVFYSAVYQIMFYSAEIHYNNPADFGASVNYIAEYMASNTSRCKGFKKWKLKFSTFLERVGPCKNVMVNKT